MSMEKGQAETDPNISLKLAIAMALVRSKLLQQPSSSPTSESINAQKWKRKAKERKQEILRLKEDLKQAEDNSQFDLFPQTALCKCYFFDNLGELSPNRYLNGSDRRFDDVLRRRFLRQVRLTERRRRRDSSTRRHCLSDGNSEDETEQLRASIDFLVELCDSISPDKAEGGNFTNWSHQAVDFILVSLRNILPKGKNKEFLEGIVSSLVVRLVRRMCTTSQGDESHHYTTDAQFYVQHLIRKLGNESYVGQRVIVAVSQRISIVADSLLFKDPFDEAFPSMHDGIYMMIQLIDFLVSDYLPTWSGSEVFDTGLFEEWVTSVVHARKALELLESRNGLYVLYMDRVIGYVTKQVGQFSSLHKLNPDILAKLYN